MAPSIYDESFLTEEQKKQIEAFQAEYQRAFAAGDHAAMDAAHTAAERVRAGQGYSGGTDGFGYIETQPETRDGYRPSRLPSYAAQTDRVNGVYDAAGRARLAALRSAYDANAAVLEAEKKAIPEIYREQKNDLASRTELERRSFNEYAAASGLNSGTAGQAQLAMTNGLQGGLAELNGAEAKARTEAENEAARLRTQYRDDIYRAVAEGELERASALLEEYRLAAQSAVSTAREQADENYRAWQSGKREAAV